MSDIQNSAESEWLKLARQGDADAFSRLVELYMPRIFALCLKLTGKREDAEDCTQETFIKAWYSLGSFGFKSSFYTWLYRIAVNTTKDMLRSRSRHQTVSLETDNSEDDSGLSYLGTISDSSPLPDEQIIEKESVNHIRNAIMQLPETMRDILLLRDFQHFSYQEISQMLDLTAGTVKSRLFRARKQLLKQLNETDPGFFGTIKTKGSSKQ